MTDLWAVFWKEGKELLEWRDGWRGAAAGLRSMLPIVALLGVVFPLEQGRSWVNTPAALVPAILFPSFLVSVVIADSIAGERERHTLETLLASPLSGQAILLGKFGACVCYSWALTLLIMALGIVTVNVTQIQSAPLFYQPMVAIGGAGLSLLVAGLVAGVGILISMRAATVRHAQQRLTRSILVLMFIPILCVQALGSVGHVNVAEILQRINWTLGGLIVSVLLLLADLTLIGVAIARFQRSRLMLES